MSLRCVMCKSHAIHVFRNLYVVYAWFAGISRGRGLGTGARQIDLVSFFGRISGFFGRISGGKALVRIFKSI